MKNSEYLLNELKRNGLVKVDFRFIEEAPEFLGQFRLNTINSFLLEIGGHRPETRIDYDKIAFYEWCSTNNIEINYDARERVYELQLKQ